MILLECLIGWLMRNSGSQGLGVRGVKNPKYRVVLGAAGRAIGRGGRRLECACMSNVK